MEHEPQRPRSAWEWLCFLFSFRGRVGRREYLIAGASLMLLKYGVDAALIHYETGEFWSPFNYLSPLLETREAKIGLEPGWLNVTLTLWALPFLWIGATMSMRRAYDAGGSPWIGLLFFVPILNYLMMLGLCIDRTRERVMEDPERTPGAIGEGLSAAVIAVVISVISCSALVLLNVHFLGNYGTALFAGTPFLLGTLSGYLYNRTGERSGMGTVGISVLATTAAGCSLALFALEGLICIGMALPIAYLIAIPGALAGRAIALSGRPSPTLHAFAPFVVLLLLSDIEARLSEPGHFECISVVEIDAPPEVVWHHVVSFSELPEPEEFLFRLGVAYPIRARIEGEGVGAVRYCEFSTGPFVEPITRWEPPSRLSFDVASQPAPMHELSPYDIHPPHLDGMMASRRGEFRLIALPGGRTRLEGSTWYDLEIRPFVYWELWSDALVHDIHERVLEHIQQLSEAEVAATR